MVTLPRLRGGLLGGDEPDWVTVSDSSQPNDGKPNYTVVSTRHTRKRRGFETARDMVWSMTAVGIGIAVLLAITWRPNPDPIKEVPWEPVISASQTLEWPVLAPRGRLEGWVSTSARNEVIGPNQQSIFIGWVTDSKQFASLAQTNAVDDTDWLAERTDRGRITSTWTDASRQVWQRVESEKQRSLVLRGDKVIYIVSGDAPWVELEQLANALR